MKVMKKFQIGDLVKVVTFDTNTCKNNSNIGIILDTPAHKQTTEYSVLIEDEAFLIPGEIIWDVKS